MTVSERFLRYIAFDTQSDEASEFCPSTQKQKLFGAALVQELHSLGVADARMDENGYVYGSLSGAADAPAVGLIAHMDTSPACSGANIRAHIVEYTGGDILLDSGDRLSPEDFPLLKKSLGKHLIVTDGKTLLGADDKAGIAEILTAIEELNAANTPHAPIRIAFTPDEEIGRGADRFDLKLFGADYAYTIDGGTLGELEYENFNAASAIVTFHGRNVHPGYAKNCMINSQLLAMEFHSMLPEHERPECTEGYEGFAHLCEMHGDEERTVLKYIIRDHDRKKFEQRKELFFEIATFMNKKYGHECVILNIQDSYYNMLERIQPNMYVVDAALQAIRDAGVTPNVVPIRGGTDGARLSYEGLPCPNLFTGGENFHGRFEYIPIEDMEAAVRVIKHILINAAKLDSIHAHN